MAELKNIRIGDVLKEYGYITEAQEIQVVKYQKEHKYKRFGEIVIELGYVSEAQMLTALSQSLSVQFVDLQRTQIDPSAVMLIPRNVSERYTAIAIGTNNQMLQVVVSDPSNLYALEDIKLVTGKNIEILCALSEQIKTAIRFQYAEIEAKVAANAVNTKTPQAEDDIQAAIAAAESSIGENNETPMVKLLNSLLVKGYTTGASDIHIEPFEHHTTVRMRVDGMLIEYMTLTKALHSSIIARLKIISGLNIAEKRTPQDGHFREKIGGYEMNVRLSTIPTVFGEKAVIRFLSTNTVLDNVSDFGMSRENAQKLRTMLKSPHGIVYLTGPTGSGKTTTLYMVLEELAKGNINIVTIEDPVERNIAKINQVQVNVEAGLTFGTGLRSILRQDPDVIMVGETRDSETASISVRSAITGHLVLSTLHTNDAVSAVTRLRDMGVEPYLLANSIVGVVAQRLVRKVCPNCMERIPTDEAQKSILGEGVLSYVRGKGCHVCNNTGFKGRTAVHEVLIVDKTVRKMIVEGANQDDMEAYLKAHGYQTLRESLRELVVAGITSFEELARLTYYVQ